MAAGQLTPRAQAFANRFGATADRVASLTGFNRWAQLVQWAVETALGQQVFGNNPGNIRCSPTTFCQFATLEDFAVATANLWHSTSFINNKYPNGFEPFRAAAAGKPMRTQLLEIGNSPWDGGNYGEAACGFAGCSLVNMWQSEFGGIGDPVAVPDIQGVVVMAVGSILLRGLDKALWAGNFDGTQWNFVKVGGALGSPAIVPVHMPNGDIHAIVTGTTGSELFSSVSTNAGQTWSTLKPIGAAGDGVVGVSLPAATVDMSPVLTAIGNVKTDTGAIKADTGAIKTATDHSLKSA